jgi:Domain of unknown function (DUF4145)
MGRVEVYREQFQFLAGPFREWPDLPCLICNRGALEPSIKEIESKDSADGRAGVETLAGPQRGFFHGELRCSRPACGNIYVVAGEWTRGSDNPDEEEEEIDSFDAGLFGLVVRHVLPPLPLIAFPDATPKKILALVDSASSALLSDSSSASNRIRTAIDALLDEQHVRKTSPKNRQRLKTHDRILLFESKNQTAAKQLMAMKWIGNVGSHEGEPLSLKLVLDGIELFARAIELIYDPREAELERLAAEINRRGGKLRATTKLSSTRR